MQWGAPQSGPQPPQGADGVVGQAEVLQGRELWQLTLQTHQVVALQVENSTPGSEGGEQATVTVLLATIMGTIGNMRKGRRP